jgi:hypothetical protein
MSRPNAAHTAREAVENALMRRAAFSRHDAAILSAYVLTALRRAGWRLIEQAEALPGKVGDEDD